jgi:hypothetical protein
MAFTAFDFLARIKAARADSFRRLDRLAVDHSRAGARLPAGCFARRHHQKMIDRLPRFIVSPPIEVALNGGEGRKVLGQHAPLATGLGDVEDCIHHGPKIRRARPTATVLRRQMRLDDCPFFIRRIPA